MATQEHATKPDDGAFLVEDFVNAISSQLDRVQDGLRLKAVNRPLTYALRDFSIDLNVFVEMDSDQNVRLRPAGPNETGASTIKIGFTTITKPMIEENTISLAQTRSPGLAELGLNPEEQRKLEQYGVRNAAEFRQLGAQTGSATIARLAGIAPEKIRTALQMSNPSVTRVTPVARPTPPTPGQGAPAVKPGDSTIHGVHPIPHSPPPIVRVPPQTRQIRMTGRNLIGDKGAPQVRLNRQPLSLAQSDHDHLVIDLPEDVTSGPLEIELPDGQTLNYHLHQDEEHQTTADPWLAEERTQERQDEEETGSI